MGRQYAMSDATVDRPTCKRITIVHERDTDTSPEQVNREAEREVFTAEQIEDFHENRWRYLGIYAVAEVHLPLGAAGATFIVDIPGPGLWGVESLSERSYLQEIADEQVGELRLVLDVLGVNHDNAEVRTA